MSFDTKVHMIYYFINTNLAGRAGFSDNDFMFLSNACGARDLFGLK
jgi:hypothetical protein